jgi:Tfp pilus assembly protein FimV
MGRGTRTTDGEELMIADDADQMATKLDLARAYIDMGDSEGARDHPRGSRRERY